MQYNTQLIGLSVEELPTPVLVLDIAIMENNIQVMMDFLAKCKTNLRPHTKTHKCPMIAHLLMKAGAIGQCCATVGEAETMVYSGVDHIFIASEITTTDKIRRTVSLARYADILVAIDDRQNLQMLSKAAEQSGVSLGVLVDVDVGMGRCGVRNLEDGVELARQANASKNIAFRGVFGYEGHAVFIEDRAERTRVTQAANTLLVDVAQAVEGIGIPVEIVTGAGTGTYDIAAEFPGITEIEAGSFLFMDKTYEKLDLPFSQSLTVLATILSRPEEDVVILDVGIKGLSVERTLPSVMENIDLEIVKLSEAHAKGVIKSFGFDDPKPGDKIRLVPSHCCTTVNLYNEIVVTRHGIVEAVWPISARGPY